MKVNEETVTLNGKKVTVFSKILYTGILLTILTTSGCQKELDNEPVAEVQGSSFNTLLKTIALNVNGSGQNITTSYQYNSSGQVTEITRIIEGPSGTSQIQRDKYFRTSTGRLDSIVYVNSTPQGNPFHNVLRTSFHYNNAGEITYTYNKSAVATFPSDSVVYTYQGNKLVQRMMYRFPGGATAYVLAATFTYTYDLPGNLTAMSVVWTNPASASKTCTYTYDSKSNPLPVMEYENELYGNWVKGFDNNFTTPNNILSRQTVQPWDWEWGSKNYEYRYSPNNKPLYQKVKHADGPGFYEVKFYYD